MKSAIAVSALFLVMMLTNTQTAAGAGDAPVPQNIQMAAPTDTIPPDIREFFGKFEGWWANQTHSVLVVREILPTSKEGTYEAHVVYAWGSSPSGMLKPGYREGSGKIEKGVLLLKSPDKPIEISFTMNRDKRLDAYHKNTQTNEIRSRATFTRQ